MLFDGSGHAAAENQDFSVNSAAHPAKSGSYLYAFVTGQGTVTPVVADGAAAPPMPLSTPVALVSVSIGGQAAQVSFAGLVPTLAGNHKSVQGNHPLRANNPPAEPKYSGIGR